MPNPLLPFDLAPAILTWRKTLNNSNDTSGTEDTADREQERGEHFANQSITTLRCGLSEIQQDLLGVFVAKNKIRSFSLESRSM